MKEQGFEKMVITFTTGILLRPSSIGIENTNQIGGIRTKVSKGENESVKTKIQKYKNAILTQKRQHFTYNLVHSTFEF